MIKRSLTLVELILSVALLSIIILGAATFSYSSAGMFRSSRVRAVILNDRNLILDYISRYVQVATGDANNAGIIVSTPGGSYVVDVRIDTSNTPDNYNDDQWVSFVYYSGSYNFYYCPPRLNRNNRSNANLISSRVQHFSTNVPGSDASNPPNVLRVTQLDLIYDPQRAAAEGGPRPHSNPQITLPIQPVSFTSHCYSIN